MQAFPGMQAVREFFEDLRRQAEPEGAFMAVVEVCGFNDGLLKMLDEYGCRPAAFFPA